MLLRLNPKLIISSYLSTTFLKYPAALAKEYDTIAALIIAAKSPLSNLPVNNPIADIATTRTVIMNLRDLNFISILPP